MKTKSKAISCEELQERLRDGRSVVVDVRSSGEFATGHVPGAVNIPLEQLQSRSGDLPSHQQLVFTCESGRRALIACELLNDDLREVAVLSGGTASWRGSGYPVVRSAASAWSLERQVRLAAGLMVFVGTVLGVVLNPLWLILPAFAGAGLMFAGLTNICGMAAVLAALPWNRPPLTQGVSTKEVLL